MALLLGCKHAAQLPVLPGTGLSSASTFNPVLMMNNKSQVAVLPRYRAMLLLKRHALTPFAVPAGLGATVRCLLLLRAQALALQVRLFL